MHLINSYINKWRSKLRLMVLRLELLVKMKDSFGIGVSLWRSSGFSCGKWWVCGLTIFFVCLCFSLTRRAAEKNALIYNHEFSHARIVSPYCFSIANRICSETISWCRRLWLDFETGCSRPLSGDAQSTTRFCILFVSELSFADKPTQCCELAFFVFSLRAATMCQNKMLGVRGESTAQIIHTAIGANSCVLSYPLRTNAQ
jgi:hypothetical protein